MNVYQQLEAGNFETVVYTVGDGVDGGSATELNALSRANIEKSVSVAQQWNDAVLFIAGGNGGSEHGRNAQDRLPGSLTEAQRMQLYVREKIGVVIPTITDCDPQFREMFGLEPSHNTPENARNAAKVVHKGRIFDVDIVAEKLHMFRVIGTFRKELQNLNLLGSVFMRSHSVPGVFEETNDQVHIQSEEAFNKWNFKANVHHILTGKVPRLEFMREWVSGNKYKHLETPFEIEI